MCSGIDELANLVNNQPYDREYARKLATLINRKHRGMISPVPPLKQALSKVLCAETNDDSKLWAQRVVELARHEFTDLIYQLKMLLGTCPFDLCKAHDIGTKKLSGAEDSSIDEDSALYEKLRELENSSTEYHAKTLIIQGILPLAVKELEESQEWD